MDSETKVNKCITQLVAMSDLQVLGVAPSVAMGNLFMTLGNTFAMAAANAVYAQQQTNITHQAATIKGVKYLFSKG